MACDITNGRKKSCKNSIAGVRTIYFVNELENSFTVTNGVATAINPLLQDVYAYELTGAGSMLAQSYVSDRNAGTSTNTQTLTVVLNKLTPEDNLQLDNLTKSYPKAIVRDRNGLFHIVGLTEGIDFTVAAATGGAQADANGYTLTGVAIESGLAPIMNAATATAFLILVNATT
jgi:hypothetical protein